MRAMAYGPSDAVDPGEIRRALVVKLRHHGEVLLASPVFSALKRAAPQAEVDALIYSETRDMLSLHPAISRLFEIERRWKSQPFWQRAAAEWRLFSALRARDYDLVIHLTDHARGAWLARALGARYRVAPDYGEKPRWWKESFTHLFPQAGLRHTVEFNLDALRRIGIQPGGERSLVLVPGEEAQSRAANLLAEHGLIAQGFVHLHPGSRWQFKCWPAGQVATLAGELHRRGERLVLTAAPDSAELEYIDEIRRHTQAPFVDLAGKLTLKVLAALTACAKLFIGVDSAPMHIAAAMGTPVVALFGPSGEAEWRPWMTAHRVVVSSAHSCRPCGNDGCGGGKVSECLTMLPLEPVLAAVEALLPR